MSRSSIPKKAKARKKGAVTPKPEAISFRVEVLPTDDTSNYYANYIEVAHSNFDFVLSFLRIPTKYSALQVERAQKTGTIGFEPFLQVTVPPKVAFGLIQALQKQCDLYEKRIGPINSAKGAKSDT